MFATSEIVCQERETNIQQWYQEECLISVVIVNQVLYKFKKIMVGRSTTHCG